MKSIYLLFFSFAQLVFFSCSEQGIYINNVSNQVIIKILQSLVRLAI